MAQNNQKTIQIQFKLLDIQQVQFATLTNEWPEGELQISNQLQFNSDTDRRVVRCLANIEFKKNDITQLILSVQSIFEFAKESWSAMYQLNTDEWVLPVGLVHHLADITIGSARGMLAIRTEEAGFPRVLLPLVHPSQIIQSNLRLRRSNPQPSQPVTQNGGEA